MDMRPPLQGPLPASREWVRLHLFVVDHRVSIIVVSIDTGHA